MADKLRAGAYRSVNPFNQIRRGAAELSAYLAAAPRSGRDPRLLASSTTTDFVADQRHRAAHGLPSLALHPRSGEATQATAGTVATNLDGVRRLLRWALETGEADRIGLDRAFIVAFPFGKRKIGRRRPYSEQVARALACEQNLKALDGFDLDNRGLSDIWVSLVTTGRRAGEVLDLRFACIERHNGLALLWHDQTKVGNLDEAIRIPDYLFDRLEQRQSKTLARFVHRRGRPPTGEERQRMALFPRRGSNPEGRPAVSYAWFNQNFRQWVNQLDIGRPVPHQARHTLATNLLRHGASLTHIKRYLGQVSERMAEHYVISPIPTRPSRTPCGRCGSPARAPPSPADCSRPQPR